MSYMHAPARLKVSNSSTAVILDDLARSYGVTDSRPGDTVHLSNLAVDHGLVIFDAVLRDSTGKKIVALRRSSLTLHGRIKDHYAAIIKELYEKQAALSQRITVIPLTAQEPQR